ncbi:MAG: phytanoyl-CoA dioxygenase family protein, partial [Longimicrobiales bacterium]
SSHWARAVVKPKLCGAVADLLHEGDDGGGPVELHHSTLHVKPPETGHPFPMHQDWAFYKHADGRYVDVLVHLDDTRHENGEIRFLPGSHKLGMLDHVVKDPETGMGCTPHLPVETYRLGDTVAVPARAGDVVVFNILTIHGSHVNVTDRMRRLVRVGYRHPDNAQTEGQSKGRPGWLVWGRRERLGGQVQFPMA